MKKLKIGISIGDVNGIGLEVILKTLSDPRIVDRCVPIIYGSSTVISYHKNTMEIEEFEYTQTTTIDDINEDKINIIECWEDPVNIRLGQVSETGGEYAIKSLDAAVSDLKMGLLDGLVTAPIHKKAMSLAGFKYPGHTEYLTQAFEVKESLMFMINGDLRVGLVTNHLPISKVAAMITKERIMEKLNLMRETLRIDFGIDKPRIAVLGLNPHAGDEGLLGDEEMKVIIPTLQEAKNKGIIAIGPYSADGFFGSGVYKQFDAILAMYHDQGLVPFKTLSFGNGVNYTAGLPIVRTSPDHGTAHDIAGKDEADPSSFRQALFLAIDIANHRSKYMEMHSNPLHKKNPAELAKLLREEEKRLKEMGEEVIKDD
ncbi:MAG: 4-hydroxythreonine-4-phosphate dehydrogenase [Saprospiraceae bacterium]|jgi:4-hydroxythreonine-4-phosphate dehydrogenase